MKTTGPLNAARYGHTATLLPSGEVLAVGGYNGLSYLSSAELYDPTNGTWRDTGSPATPRIRHTATLLPNAKVLVTGGTTNSSGVALLSAELYDATTRTWTTTGPLNNARYAHTATLLYNGTVLVAGGFNSGTLTNAEIYDPATGIWTPTGALNLARRQHTTTLLPDGKVLVADGQGKSNPSLSNSEVYDPVTGTWSSTNAMTAPRYNHAATLLPNGKVLVAGGGNIGAFYSSAELYDPATRKWTATSSMTNSRLSHTATLLPNGKVLVAGGATNTIVLSGVELYDVGLGFDASWQPQIGTVTSPLKLGDSLAITGSQFRGVSGGSGGNSQDSPTDYPVVQLRSLESGQTLFLSPTNWSANSFASTPINRFPPGYALVTVFVNGIPSTSSVVNVSVPIPTAPKLIDAKTLTNGSFQFAFTNSVGVIFGVLTTTNVAWPLTNWTALGGVTEISPGQFQFTDPQATDGGQRFYTIRSP